jgi:hypothetical protein
MTSNSEYPTERKKSQKNKEITKVTLLFTFRKLKKISSKEKKNQMRKNGEKLFATSKEEGQKSIGVFIKIKN